MPNTTTNTPVPLTDDALDTASAGTIPKNIDSTSPRLAELRANGFFRPNPSGDGTTEHFLTSIQEDERGL
ncbi:MAG: hypothetical protein AAGH68_12835 [Pseudomonadota bacterium]